MEDAARSQLRQAGLAALTRHGGPDAVVAAALARNPDLWRRLHECGVSVSRVAGLWMPDGNAAWPERRLAEVVEPLATPGTAWEAREAIAALAHRVRIAYLRLQASVRALDLQSTHVRSFQAATALSRSDQAFTDHAGERAAAQRARLELVRLQTEAASQRRELEVLMGFAAGAPEWSPVPGPPPLPPARQDPRLEEAIAQALAARADLGTLRASDDPDDRARAAELELAIRARVIDAHARLSSARLVGEACRDALIPMHERIVELALDRFRAGTLDAATLLSAQRELVVTRRQEIESLRDYWIARLDLHRAAAD
jgi:outer membrane protein TolC